MTHYANGTAFERRVKKHLEANGYWVFRSAGSHSEADLVALKATEVLLVQCKSGKGSVSHDEWNALDWLARHLMQLGLVADRDPERPRRIRFRQVMGQHYPKSRTWPCRNWTADEIAG